MMVVPLLFSQASTSQLLDAPITTGAIFLALTGAIAYLYRARDRDRDSEHDRLIQTIDRLTETIEQLREERDTP